MRNNLIKLLTNDKEVRLYVVDAEDVLRMSNLNDMKTDFARQLYKKAFVNCCMLRGLLSEKDQRISVSMRFNKDGYSAHCDIDGNGSIHCIFSSRLMAFTGSFQDLIGKGATLSITRGSWTGGMFTGTVEINCTSIDCLFSYFYSKSEQIETIFKTWTDNGAARGCMIQPLPFAHEDNVKRVIESIFSNELNMKTTEFEKLPQKAFPYANVIEKYIIQSECSCSKDAFWGMLISVDINDLKKSVLMNQSEELECGICGKRYTFAPKELEAIIKVKESG